MLVYLVFKQKRIYLFKSAPSGFPTDVSDSVLHRILNSEIKRVSVFMGTLLLSEYFTYSVGFGAFDDTRNGQVRLNAVGLSC